MKSLLKEYELNEYELLTTFNRNLSKKFWENQGRSFHLYDNFTEVHMRIGDQRKKHLEDKICNLISDGLDLRYNADFHSADTIIYSAYRIELKKQAVKELKKAKKLLLDLRMEKSNKPALLKNIGARLKIIDNALDLYKHSTENIFITENQKRDFVREKKLEHLFDDNWLYDSSRHLFEFTTIWPLLRFGEKYDAVLDLLKKERVPNIDLFYSLKEKSKEAFSNPDVENMFVGYASAYLIYYRENALEDVIRQIPLKRREHHTDYAPYPNLGNLAKEKKFRNKITELGLPLKETTKFFSELNHMIRSSRSEYFNSRVKFFKASKDFYKAQLINSNDAVLKWAGAIAIIDSVQLESNEIAVYRELTKELPDIIKYLNLPSLFPNLAKNKSFLIDRFLMFESDEHTGENGNDPYFLSSLDALLEPAKQAKETLKKYGININLHKFMDIDKFDGMKRAFEWINKNLNPGKNKELQNYYFFKELLFNKFDLIQKLREYPYFVEERVPIIKELSLDFKLHSQYLDEKEERKARKLLLDSNVATYDLYRNFLGKSIAQYIRDLNTIGKSSMSSLPEIKNNFINVLGKEKTANILNYLIKKRNRDLIDELYNFNDEKNRLSAALFKKTDMKEGKRNLVKYIYELNKTCDFLKEVNCVDKLDELASKLRKNTSIENIISLLHDTRKNFYKNMVGADIEIPAHLKDMVDNVVVAYYKNINYNSLNINDALKFLVSSYMQHGPEKAIDMVRSIEPNKTLREKLIQMKIDIDSYEQGISRTYRIKTDDSQSKILGERIKSQFDVIYERLSLLRMDADKLEKIKTQDMEDQLKEIEGFMAKFQFDSSNSYLKSEINGHIHSIKSIEGTRKEVEDDVKFYVSQDILEALHMGQFFHTCMSLFKNYNGVNAWASVVQVMDSNKNVIYAKGSKGDYIARNRTALTDKGIMCTRFYQNNNLPLENAWFDYLSEYAKNTKQDVLIPNHFASASMEKHLKKKMEADDVKLKKMAVHIAPAYFNDFYSDGLSMKKLEDNRLQITSEFYIIKHDSH